MKCKYCQGEVDEGTSVCPHCGELIAENRGKKADPRLVVLAVGLCALLLAALVAVVVYGINSVSEPTEPTEESIQPTESIAATQPSGSSTITLTIPELGDSASYTVSADALHVSADAVVATAGERTLTGEQLQVFYWMQFVDFMNQNGYYAYYLIDPAKPFDQQTLPDSSITWEQYFLDCALQTWYRYTVLDLMAKADGFELDQELKDTLEAMPQVLQDTADEGEYESVAAMIEQEMGPGCTLDAYMHYTQLYYTAISYFNHLYETMDPSEDEIRAFYEENAEVFASQGLTEETPPYVDVRHILLMPTGGTADASGNVTYSEAEWEACRQEAQGILDTWLAGEATEESFAELANTHSKDGGSNTTGGLYTYVTDDGTYVPEFTAWCMDESRQVGDTGLVKTQYGYHIMFFARSEEAWHLISTEELLAELGGEKIRQGENSYPFGCDTGKIQVGGVTVEE